MIKEDLISYGYHHLDAGHPDNQKNYRICGCETRQSESKPICHRPAGWGTSHPGVGRCKLHGGCSPSGPDHPNWRGGRYAYKFKGRLIQHYQNKGLPDTINLDLLPELQVQRTLLTMAIIALNERGLQSQNNENKLEVDNLQTTVTVGSGGVGISLQKGYPVDNTHAEFSPSDKDLLLVSELVNDIVNTIFKIHTIHNKNVISKTEVNYLLTKIKQGMDRFVPLENREAFVRWLQKEVPNDEANI